MSRFTSAAKLAVVSAALLASSSALAAFTFPAFTVNVSNTSAAGLEPTFTSLTGAPAGSYNAYSVSVDWGGSINDAWSNEAIFALIDSTDLVNGVFYADPGVSSVSAGNPTPRTLTWSGLLDVPYSGGDPLVFAAAQTFAPSGATWSNITVTLDTVTILSTSFSGDTTGDPTWTRPFADFSGLSGLGVGVTYEVIPFFVDTPGSYAIEETQAFDGFMYLYEDSFDPLAPLVNGVVGNDDGAGGIGTSDFIATLTPGTQYYLVTTGFEPGEEGTYSGTITGPGVATLGLIPEPSSLSLVAAAGLMTLRRRRAA